MSVRLSTLSREYVKVPVRRIDAGQPVDPTADGIEFAFVDTTAADANPAAWTSGTWESSGDQHWGRCLVGPGGDTVLAAGTYNVWVRISGTPEVPVQRSTGKLVVF